MNFLGHNGHAIFGVPFTNSRILLAEDSNVFTQMVSSGLTRCSVYPWSYVALSKSCRPVTNIHPSR